MFEALPHDCPSVQTRMMCRCFCTTSIDFCAYHTTATVSSGYCQVHAEFWTLVRYSLCKPCSAFWALAHALSMEPLFAAFGKLCSAVQPMLGALSGTKRRMPVSCNACYKL